MAASTTERVRAHRARLKAEGVKTYTVNIRGKNRAILELLIKQNYPHQSTDAALSSMIEAVIKRSLSSVKQQIKLSNELGRPDLVERYVAFDTFEMNNALDAGDFVKLITGLNDDPQER